MDANLDWSSLLPDVLRVIARKLPTIKDYIRFRAVCRSWCGAASITGQLVPREFPWLMFPLSDCAPSLRFLNPQTNDLIYAGSKEEPAALRVVGSSFGWLILLGKCSSIFLLNPLTLAKIELPQLFWRSPGWHYISTERICLSHSPSEDSNFVALAILGYPGGILYLKNGDSWWRNVYREANSEGSTVFVDAVYFRGKICAIDGQGSLTVFELSSDHESCSLWNCRQFFPPLNGSMRCLADVMDDLVLISLHFVPDLWTNSVSMFRFDWMGRKWDKLDDLKGRCLFLSEGACSSFSLPSNRALGCEENTIYFIYSRVNRCEINDELYGLARNDVSRDKDYHVAAYSSDSKVTKPLPFYVPTPYQPLWFTPRLC
ncbi:hypothetical protein M569_03456 [Genlisea aurea]|uniref:KIB1-4 beta-propeller domain-containing protein n=1 Tax=Genlisea aurea TaxID=192259 RepID=S8CWS2_9LAMI|nr:hypothetical protein M569_03456 [Genlisea aurea]